MQSGSEVARSKLAGKIRKFHELQDAGQVQQALRQLESAVKKLEKGSRGSKDPGLPVARTLLARSYLSKKSYDRCIKHASRALEDDQSDINTHLLLIDALEKSSKLKKAREQAMASLNQFPGSPYISYLAALVERRLGEPEQARKTLEPALSCNDLKLQRLAWFEAGNILDRTGHYNEAWSAFSRANNLARAQQGSGRNDFLEEVTNLLGRKTFKDCMTSRFTIEQEPPVFMVGFPRSGTTLLENIIAGSDRLVSIEEKETIIELRNRIVSKHGNYLDYLCSATADEKKSWSGEYFSVLQGLGVEYEGKVVVDKMPLHIAYIPVIHSLFPGSRILLSLRHPYDCCLSSFMQNFVDNPAMENFYSLEGAANLYSKLFDLFEIYRRDMDLDIYTLRYEDLVADTEAEITRLCQWLDIPFQQEMLDYARRASKRNIATPSYAQVTRSIYSESVHRWKNYSFAIEEVKEMLRPYAEGFGYES